MSLTWLRNVNPQILEQYATEWEQIGSGLEGVYQKYVDAVTKTNDQYWEGKAATAAQDRANGDLKTGCRPWPTSSTDSPAKPGPERR
ncbi:hypothetical protein ACIP5Y_40665 [Nocardia sp. NPDC088792]|uniref:hypothetical protein n=1 Tax=Nocardia sp. NPDC088792 TaxID=3364332 RepID=UPI0038040220